MSKSSTTQYAILGLLTIQPMSGYDLGKNLRESLSYFWTESNGQLYPALKRLVADGWIAPTATRQVSKRTRQKYTLTSAGRKRLKEWLRVPPRFQPPRNELLLKLFLARSAPDGLVAEHISSFKREHEESLRRFARLHDSITKEHAESPDLKYWMLCLDHGIRMRQAQIDWCNSALDALGTATQSRRRKRGAAP